MNEQKNPTFSQALNEYINMALSIWPGLKISLCNLSSAVAPPEGSPIPNRNYREMSEQEFIKQIGSDLHDYIMEHDVKSQHFEQYLDDILAILNSEQENFMTIRYMANELDALIKQIPQQNFDRLYNFRQIYDEVKSNSHSIVHQHQGDSSEDDGQGSYDEDNDAQIDEQNDEQIKQSEQVPQLMSQQEQQELEDDGWVVVKKKSNKK